MATDPKTEGFARFLDRTRDQLGKWVEREARGLLKRESVDDVVAGIHARALSQLEGFELRSDAEGFNWLKTIARQHVLDRQKYFAALRRQGGEMLRITSASLGDTPDARPGVQVAGRMTGQVTYAMRREAIDLAAKAIASLLPRDQEIVRRTVDGASVEDVAKEFRMSYDAAEQARRRAMERFKKAYELLSRG